MATLAEVLARVKEIEARQYEIEREVAKHPARKEFQDSLRELHEKTNNIRTLVDTGFGEMTVHIERQGREIIDLRSAVLEGNGQKPLKTRIVLLEEENKRSKELEEKRDDEAKELKKHRWGMVVTFLIAVLGWLYELIKEGG